MIPNEIRLSIESWLIAQDPPSTIVSVKPVGGGSINQTFQIKTRSGSYFIKYNLSKRFPGMFAAESAGLALLRDQQCITIPEVLLCEETDAYSFLLLNFIEETEPVKDFWQIFGTRLASLHRKSSTEFGLDHDNYIGSLNQSNNRHRSWIEFLILERIHPQLKIAVDSGHLGSQDVRRIDSLCKNLPEIIPEEIPALLHGDLWSGNFMTGSDGLPVIFDPAVYYGHRETDIGMTKLFGGFSSQFYQTYHESFPMEKGWENRIEINQLYPLLVHVNLFGGGYATAIRKITGKF